MRTVDIKAGATYAHGSSVRQVTAIQLSLLAPGDADTVTYVIYIPERDGSYRKQVRTATIRKFSGWARKRIYDLGDHLQVPARPRRARFRPDQIHAGTTYTNGSGSVRRVELVDRHDGRVLYDLIYGPVMPRMVKEGGLYSCALETFIRWAVATTTEFGR